ASLPDAIGNRFNLDSPIGGNYWDDITTRFPDCDDDDNDGFYDCTYEILLGGNDYLPWATENGWKAITVALDIKPGSCENEVNIRRRGVKFPVVILGTEGFNVNDIDLSSLELAGVSPKRWAIKDVAIEGQCDGFGTDEYDDLILMFKTKEIVKALGEVADEDPVTLTLTGELNDGIQIIGEDTILFVKKGKHQNKELKKLLKKVKFRKFRKFKKLKSNHKHK
ncbi:unnamed protein product, partial [marine sediment metagenome]